MINMLKLHKKILIVFLLPLLLFNITCSKKIRLQSSNYTNMFVLPWEERIQIMTTDDPELIKLSLFKIIPGLANPFYVSIKSVYYPNCYLRHQNSILKLTGYKDDPTFKKDATFKIVKGLHNSKGVSFRSYNYKDLFIRHRNNYLEIGYDNSVLFKQDATFLIIKK